MEVKVVKVSGEKLFDMIVLTATLIGTLMTYSADAGKEFLKRIFFGKLILLPPEIKDGMAEYNPPVPIPNDSPNYEYKVIYAVARLTKEVD